MKSFSLLLLSLFLLSACGQEGTLSTAETDSQSTDSPVIVIPEPAQKEQEITVEKKTEAKVEVPPAPEEDSV